MSEPDQQRNGRKALTSIPRRIHCGATEDPMPDENAVDVLDEIAINDFINTLAEVAMAVAARRLAKGNDGG